MSNCKNHVFSLALHKLNVCDSINSIQLSQNYDVNKSTPEGQYPVSISNNMENLIFESFLFFSSRIKNKCYCNSVIVIVEINSN